MTENPKQVLALLQLFLQRLAVTDMQQLHRAGSCAFCGLLPLESHVLDEAELGTNTTTQRFVGASPTLFTPQPCPQVESGGFSLFEIFICSP